MKALRAKIGQEVVLSPNQSESDCLAKSRRVGL